jgi:hypothetical protein
MGENAETYLRRNVAARHCATVTYVAFSSEAVRPWSDEAVKP